MTDSSKTGNSNGIIGNYMLGDFIGEGSFGKVYKAWHLYLNKQICIKIVQSDLLNEELENALWSEAQVLQALDHKNIVRLQDLTIQNNQICMLIDYVDGGDLATTMETEASPLPLSEADYILGQIAEGLHYAQVLNDPLTSTNHGSDWAGDSLDNSSGCSFFPTGYQNQATGSDTCNYGSGSAHVFSNLAYSVQVKITQGEQAGLIFHLLSNNYYTFDIAINGTYVVTRHIGAGNGNDVPLISPTYASAIHTGLDQVNTLAVIAINNQFQFWINNQLVTSASDATDPSGTIGTGINALGNNDVKTIALFQQAQVWTPPS